jgi:hypothetical protein
MVVRDSTPEDGLAGRVLKLHNHVESAFLSRQGSFVVMKGMPLAPHAKKPQLVHLNYN